MSIEKVVRKVSSAADTGVSEEAEPVAISARTFFGALVSVTFLVFGLAWTLRIFHPSGFLPGDYAIWKAKLDLVENCQLAPTVVLGDSRAVAGMHPHLIEQPIVNLALTGAGPIEAFYMARRALSCPNPPRTFLFSVIFNHFMNDQMFWPFAASFDLLNYHDLEEIRAKSRSTDDSVVFPQKLNGVYAAANDYLYSIKFPTTYSSNLIQGALLWRSRNNAKLFGETLRDFGYHPIGGGEGQSSNGPPGDAFATVFAPTPLLDAYFHDLVSLAQLHGVHIYFVNMPVSKAYASHLDPKVWDDFVNYLLDISMHYANFDVLNSDLVVWEDSYFADRDLHLNASGAARFSRSLSQVLTKPEPTGPTRSPAAASRKPGSGANIGYPL